MSFGFGFGFPVRGGVASGRDATTNNVEIESGFNLLLENGEFILLEG